MEEFTLQTLKCNRCNHTWIPRVNPLQCPKCKSYYWNETKEYDKRKKEFKDVKFKLDEAVKEEVKEIIKKEVEVPKEGFFKSVFNTTKKEVA